MSGGNKCTRLKVPPTNVEACAFLGDSVDIRCSGMGGATDEENEVSLEPNGVDGLVRFPSILEDDGGSFMCNTTTEFCGDTSDMLNLQVYGEYYYDKTGTYQV